MKIARRKMRCEIPSMAMGDIAFNLLVFFVILARAQDDSHLKWTPANTPKVESAGQARVSIVIDKKNDLFLNGRQIGISQLADAIEELLGNSPAGERTVLLKVDKDILAQRFEPVIEAIGEAGGDLVHILHEKKEQGTP
jgi:biopolymer transport protein ExbD